MTAECRAVMPFPAGVDPFAAPWLMNDLEAAFKRASGGQEPEGPIVFVGEFSADDAGIGDMYPNGEVRALVYVRAYPHVPST